MVKGDLSLHDGCGADTVLVTDVALAGPVGPGMRLTRENTDVTVWLAA